MEKTRLQIILRKEQIHNSPEAVKVRLVELNLESKNL